MAASLLAPSAPINSSPGSPTVQWIREIRGTPSSRTLTSPPLDAKGLVEYSTKFQILMPVDESKGNHIMLSEVVNRGNETSPGTFNIGTSTANPQGDGFLENQGLTLVWAGWQADLVAPASNPNLITMSAPIAHHHSGKTITGVVRSEWTVSTPTGAPGTQNILAEFELKHPRLSQRHHQQRGSHSH